MAPFDPITYARNIGQDHGRNAASWFFDGSTDRATYEAFRRGLEDGDPAIEDQLPAADLSGQYADGYTLRDLLSDCGVDEGDELVDIDELINAYEEGFADAARADVERQISIQLDGEEEKIMNTSTGRYDATHAVIRVDGSEVRPGDTVINFRGEPAIFRSLTRVPGDGTATTGKIVVDEPDWEGAERYAHVYDLTVVAR